MKEEQGSQKSYGEILLEAQAEKKGISIAEAAEVRERWLARNAEKRKKKIQEQRKLPDELPEGLLKMLSKDYYPIPDEKRFAEAEGKIKDKYSLLPEMKRLSVEIDRLKGEISDIETRDGIPEPVWNIHHSKSGVKFGQESLEQVAELIQKYLDRKTQLGGNEPDNKDLSRDMRRGKDYETNFTSELKIAILHASKKIIDFRWAVKELSAASQSMKNGEIAPMSAKERESAFIQESMWEESRQQGR